MGKGKRGSEGQFFYRGCMFTALILCFAFTSGCQLSGSNDLPLEPLPGIDVLHYEVDLNVDPSTRLLLGRVMLHVAHPDSATALPLLFQGMTVDSVVVNGMPAEAMRMDDLLTISLEQGVDTSRIMISYHGVPQKGFYEQSSSSQPVYFSDAWPVAGSGWLPGVHHPADPATFALTLTIPAGYEAVASGTPQSIDTLSVSVRYRWSLDVPVPTYSFAFAIADFTVFEASLGDSLPIRYYMLSDDTTRADMLARTPQALAFFSQRFGPYPFASYASVEVPIRYAGMENAATSFLQPDLFRAGEAEAVQVHELAHQWFGNRVPIASWNDLWLSEGTATYLETLFTEHADGLDAARTQWVAMAELNMIKSRTQTILVPDQPTHPNTMFTWVPYDKGASVLHLLRRKLGDEYFFAAMRKVYAEYAGKPLSTKAFQQVIAETSQQDLAEFFDYWVYGEQLPELHTRWDSTTRTLAWTIEEDGGTLEGIPFELQMQQGDELLYIDAAKGSVVLSDHSRPQVRPVGVFMKVR